MKTYYAAHSLVRSDICTPDADAIVQRVNSLTGSNGDSASMRAVQAEIDAIADAKTQALFKISIVEFENEDE